jgi:hypothetical protein
MKSMRTLALVTVLGLVAAAFAVPTASALEFRSTKSPETVLGNQDVSGIHKFEVEKQVTECKQAKMEAKGVFFATKTLNLTPEWQLKANECPVTLGFTSNPKEVEPEGCTFELLEPVLAGMATVGNLAIRCAAGKSIKLRGGSLFGTCEVRIGEVGNENLPKITYGSSGSMPTKITAKFEVTGITANKTVDSGTCGLAGAGVIKTVSYSGTSTFEGTGGAGLEIK